MATLHLMCGLPGAGKTTRARELEQQLRAVRLTPDEWITRFLGSKPALDVLDAARDPAESLQWELAARLLALGVDVILDFGFWSREERESFRSRAAALGAGSVVHFLDVPDATLRERLIARQRDRPLDTFDVTPEQLAKWSAVFQRPSRDERRPRDAP